MIINYQLGKVLLYGLQVIINNMEKVNKKEETIAILTINGLPEMCGDDLAYLSSWLGDKKKEIDDIYRDKISSFEYSERYRSRLII